MPYNMLPEIVEQNIILLQNSCHIIIRVCHTAIFCSGYIEVSCTFEEKEFFKRLLINDVLSECLPNLKSISLSVLEKK